MGSGVVGKDAVLWQKVWRAVRLNNVDGPRKQKPEESEEPSWQPAVWLSDHKSQYLSTVSLCLHGVTIIDCLIEHYMYMYIVFSHIIFHKND